MKLNILLMVLIVVFMTSCSMVYNFPLENNTNNSNVLILSENDSLLNESNDFEIILNETEVQENITSEQSLNGELLFAITVKEGEMVSLNLEAQDPDGDEVEYTYSEPFDENGNWQTEIGDAGKYMIKVKATDGILSTTETVMVLVESVNQAPIIDCPTKIEVKEGEELVIACSFSDLNGDKVTYEVVGFIDDLKYQTTYNDAGEYEISIIATDGMQSSKQDILIVIENVNQAPVLALETEITAVEKDLIKLNYEAKDDDGDEVVVMFSNPFSGLGKWQTEIGDAGEYEVTLTASDGIDTVEKTILVKVTQFNLPPMIEIADELTFKENELITLPLKVTDPNNDEVSITVSGFMNALTYQTTYEDAGEYEVTITATDGVNEISKTVKLIIENVNRPPQFIWN
ncbi:MAG: hypothetical protein AB7V77_04175 [Candidatus Woesearchaeota archaeon]